MYACVEVCVCVCVIYIILCKKFSVPLLSIMPTQLEHVINFSYVYDDGI